MYDLIILGSGPGGYVAAAKAGKAGLKTLVIEKNELGGICLHRGCIPTKALLSSAQRLMEVKDAKSHGIHIEGDIQFSWQEMQKRKDKVVSRLNKGIEALFKQNKVEWIQGEGKTISPNKVQVGSETVSTKHLLIATGAKDLRPDIPGLKELYEQEIAFSSTEILLIKEIPEKLLILGEDVFATEYASLFSALGSRVSLLAPQDRIIPHMDVELSDFLRRELAKQGVEIILNAEVSKFNGKDAHYKTKGEEKSTTFDKVLVALGSTANLSGLETLGLEKDNRGFIKTDEFMRTSEEDVYAIGDVNGKFPLAHVASKEGVLALSHILGKSQAMDYNKLPIAVYSMPEIASVGLSEEEAKKKYGDVKVSKYFMSANGKALAEGDSKGFAKILSIPPYDEVIGVHLAGNKATDLIAEGVLALQLEATLEDLASAVHAHPTPSETIMEAANSLL